MWTGDVWKLVPDPRQVPPDLKISLVDCQSTGLVCVTGLDPGNRVPLRSLRDEILGAFDAVPNAREPIAAMYAAHPWSPAGQSSRHDHPQTRHPISSHHVARIGKAIRITSLIRSGDDEGQDALEDRRERNVPDHAL